MLYKFNKVKISGNMSFFRLHLEQQLLKERERISQSLLSCAWKLLAMSLMTRVGNCCSGGGEIMSVVAVV